MTLLVLGVSVPSLCLADVSKEGYQAVVISKDNDPEDKPDRSSNASSSPERGGPLTDEPKTSSIERWVQPLTRWAEDQLHDTSLVRTPNKDKDSNSARKQSAISLREAIKLAREEYPGMVLGAESISEEEPVRYEVRIISSEGVIKTVSVSSVRSPEDNSRANSETNTLGETP